jgi:hypothetical protein
VTDQWTQQGEQPAFVYATQVTGAAKLLLSSEKKKALAQGLSPRVLIYPWGLTWILWTPPVTSRWEEVAAVWQHVVRHSTNGVHTRTDYTYSLQRVDGATAKVAAGLGARADRQSRAQQLSFVPGYTTDVTIEQLGRLLQTFVTRALLPQYVAAFNAGQTVRFGPLLVSPQGIAAGDKSVLWSEIDRVQTSHGYVSVRKAGKWLSWKSVGVSQIPNYFVFNELVNNILAQRSVGPAG